MIKEENGKSVLSYEATGVIRRIPLEKRGVARSGREWVLGSVLLEVTEDDAESSAQLFLQTWDDLMVETLNRIGVGKQVKVRYHIECREYYDSYKTNLILDDIAGMTDGEDFVYGTKKKGE